MYYLAIASIQYIQSLPLTLHHPSDSEHVLKRPQHILISLSSTFPSADRRARPRQRRSSRSF